MRYFEQKKNAISTYAQLSTVISLQGFNVRTWL